MIPNRCLSQEILALATHRDRKAHLGIAHGDRWALVAEHLAALDGLRLP